MAGKGLGEFFRQSRGQGDGVKRNKWCQRAQQRRESGIAGPPGRANGPIERWQWTSVSEKGCAGQSGGALKEPTGGAGRNQAGVWGFREPGLGGM